MKNKLPLIFWAASSFYGLANAEVSEHDHVIAGSSAESAPTIGIPSGQSGMEVVNQTLVQPPFVPLHEQSVGKVKPKIVHVDLSIEEKKFVVIPTIKNGQLKKRVIDKTGFQTQPDLKSHWLSEA